MFIKLHIKKVPFRINVNNIEYTAPVLDDEGNQGGALLRFVSGCLLEVDECYEMVEAALIAVSYGLEDHEVIEAMKKAEEKYNG